MKKPEFNKQADIFSIVSDAELEKVFGLFGKSPDRNELSHMLLQSACGYEHDPENYSILRKLGLGDNWFRLTPKGRRYLYEAFADKIV